MTTTTKLFAYQNRQQQQLLLLFFVFLFGYGIDGWVVVVPTISNKSVKNNFLYTTTKTNKLVQPSRSVQIAVSSERRQSTDSNDESTTVPNHTTANNNIPNEIRISQKTKFDRRSFIISSSILTVTGTLALWGNTEPVSAAVQRAVGSGEYQCRTVGNCLEIGELDGAVGWDWGGKDRCDPSDPLCGPDGKLRSSPLVGKPVPTLPYPNTIITHVIILQISIGRDEIGILKIGLYGNDCPGSVSELVDFISPTGLSTLDSSTRADFLQSFSIPVSLTRGGVVTGIVPGTSIELGVPSQTNAYGRSRGMSKTDGFIPQPKPSVTITSNDSNDIRKHDCAGLISIPRKGLGYGGNGFESNDEIYESAFLITDNAVPSYDTSRRVIGQILDSTSMAFVERLANLPTKRGIRGVIPGQLSGPPLLKTIVRDCQVAKVSAPPPVINK